VGTAHAMSEPNSSDISSNLARIEATSSASWNRLPPIVAKRFYEIAKLATGEMYIQALKTASNMEKLQSVYQCIAQDTVLTDTRAKNLLMMLYLAKYHALHSQEPQEYPKDLNTLNPRIMCNLALVALDAFDERVIGQKVHGKDDRSAFYVCTPGIGKPTLIWSKMEPTQTFIPFYYPSRQLSTSGINSIMSQQSDEEHAQPQAEKSVHVATTLETNINDLD